MRSSAALMSNSSAFAALRAEKDAVRRALRTTLRSLPAEQLAQESAAITERLLASEVFKRSSRVGIYVSCDRLCEVNTHAVLHALFRTGGRQRCFTPHVMEGQAQMSFLRVDSFADLVASKMGILEPTAVNPDGQLRETAAPGSLDLLIVPGVAFDPRGRRLGRGGGYYDQLFRTSAAEALELKRAAALRVALAFEAQLQAEGGVPFDGSTAAGDELVDVVLTASSVSGPGTDRWH